MNRHGSGASLLELLIAVAVVAILATIAAIPAVASLRATREGRAVANLRAVGSAQLAHYASRRRFAVFDELLRTGALGGGFARAAEGGGPLGSPSEAVSDGVYLYSIRYSSEADGLTIDADPVRSLAASYRRFRFRLGREISGKGGAEGVVYAAAPSVASPPASAYRPLGAP